VKPRASALEQLSGEEVRSYEWTDDLDFRGLEEALDLSAAYYRRLPAEYQFNYGGEIYSPSDMLASLDMFGEIISTTIGDERARLLKERFSFFESINSDGGAFFTGYYEPVLGGSPVPTEEFPEPLYGIPDDLIEADLGKFSKKWRGEKIVGRVDGNRLIPYDSREEIVEGRSLDGRARPIAYVDGIELFFLQIQGSGLIRLPDGRVKRVNYAQKNGHPYRAIGRLLKEQIPPEEMSLQSIKEYLRQNPDEVRKILNYNQSYTFFREVEEGPLGYIDVPLTPGRSIAMDRRVIPRGGLAFIETEFPVFENGEMTGSRPVKRFVMVQDTGGAITGHGRVDIFVGRGEEAEVIAGHLKQSGRVFLVVAKKECLEAAKRESK
jgi:membrane-bound lytic murein transglycosylase A